MKKQHLILSLIAGLFIVLAAPSVYACGGSDGGGSDDDEDRSEIACGGSDGGGWQRII